MQFSFSIITTILIFRLLQQDDHDSTYVIKIVPTNNKYLYDIEYEVQKKDGTIIFKEFKNQQNWKSYEVYGKKLSISLSHKEMYTLIKTFKQLN